MPVTVEGFGVLLCVSLPTRKMGVKVVFFVPLHCAPKRVCHLLSMHRPFIPPIPPGKINLATCYLAASDNLSSAIVCHLALLNMPWCVTLNSYIFLWQSMNVHYFSQNCVEIIFRLFSLRTNETEKNRWRKCQSSRGTGIRVNIQIWSWHNAVFCFHIFCTPLVLLLGLFSSPWQQKQHW